MNRLLSPRSILSLLLLVLTAGVVFLLAGCRGGTQEAGASAVSHDGAPGGPTGATTEDSGSSGNHVYKVRGQIQELPDSRDPLSGLYIHHEAIDDWIGIDGEVQGMDSMTMPFPVAEDVNFEGIKTGDNVTFTLEVNYDADPAVQVTGVHKLPDDTELEFRSARPPE